MRISQSSTSCSSVSSTRKPAPLGVKGLGELTTVSYIFVHASALDRAGIMGLADGQRVAVYVIDGRKGPEAAGLRLI
jgi:cold shock CspA family protein